MANDTNRLIDMLYERIEDAKSPALKPNMSMVDRDEMLDLLDELRAQLPVEIKRAQELLAAREKFVDDAKRDVDRMMRQAELEAKTKVSDSEVLYAAKEKARQIVAQAEERAASCIRWPMNTQRMPWDAPRKRSRQPWMKSNSPGCASGQFPAPKCRSSGIVWMERWMWKTAAIRSEDLQSTVI